MIVHTHFIRIAAAALYAALASTSMLHGQPLTMTSTSGVEFNVLGRPSIAPDNVSDGRRFRGANRETLILRGPLHMPAGNLAEHKLMKLIVRFHTGRNGPGLYEVTVGPTKRAIGIQQGDYTRQETRNVVTYNGMGVDQLDVRLSISFAGGIDSTIGGQEFVLTRVDAYFPVKLHPPSEKVSAVTTVPGLGNQPSPAPTIPLGNVNAVIYTVSNTDHLMWSRHDGMADGTFNWPSGLLVVGNGWNFKQVFSSGGGVLYVITPNGDLLWYHHDGIVDGTFRWASFDARKVGTNWNYRQVFPAGGGVIYAINDNGDLLWFHHSGQRDGSMNWTSTEGKVVGTGWNFKRVFSGGEGVIYALEDSGDLHWYRHEGRADGSATWAPNSGTKVGSGWTVDHIFSSGHGVIYMVNNANELIWFRHTGISDGSPTWSDPGGKKVGTGWVVKSIFSGANLRP